ncbi:MAG: response regulator transcription factor [Acidimicrobiia bacterium]|nr:response regulator transcription factor [Acidimicrobiia bacterium]
MTAASRSVLVVEDDPHIQELVCLHLGLDGYHCEPVATGTDALKTLGERTVDVVVLDVMLPGVDGIAVCRAIRRQGLNRQTPVLMLTARREESDTVVGLESGADDYLTKPFGVRELVARVNALTRRASRHADDSPQRTVSLHGIELDPARRTVRVRGALVETTRQEFALLYTLASQPGVVFSRQRLLAKVWQGQAFVTDRSVDTLVKRVRRKVEVDPSAPRIVQTIWGDGYKCADA